MQRLSDYVILLEDLGRQVKRKNYHPDKVGKTYVEYWVYKPKIMNILLPDGTRAKNYDNMPLEAIIVCDNIHIVGKTDKTILVRGIKFTDPHLANWLSKTKRTRG